MSTPKLSERLRAKVICPVCKGHGKIKPPGTQGRKSELVANNRVMAKLLVGAGYSLRETMRFLGYKSTRSIMLLIGTAK